MTHLLQGYLNNSALSFADSTAVVDHGKRYTYRTLSESVASLAKLLDNRNPNKGLIGIYLPKSFDAIVAQFAALEANIPYTPFDVLNSPPERIWSIISNYNISSVITTRQVWEKFIQQRGATGRPPSSLHIDTIFMEDAPAQQPVSSDTYRLSTRTELDLAFVLFTSGSTGVPKGVQINHRNALTFTEWALSYFKIAPQTRFASVASFSFDLSIFDIFVSVATGGELHLMSPHLFANPRGLVKWIQDSKVEIWYSVPSVWVAVLKYATVGQTDLASLRKILFAGEVFPPAQLMKLFALCPEASFFNLYGPTESNVCTCYEVPKKVMQVPPPIGLPCDNYEVLVLDDKLQETDADQIGEIMIYGPGVTAGYYRNKDATTEVFVPSPFLRHRGGELYRTGDLARRDASGLISYVGRRDHMVKVAGYRVEILDVENAISKCAEVAEAAAVTYELDDLAVSSLGVLAVPAAALRDPKENAGALIKTILTSTTELLPTYMVPTKVFLVESLPRNENGKLDRTKCREMFLAKINQDIRELYGTGK